MKNRVRELRTERGWSQSEFARMLEISRQSVHAIETGKFSPSLPIAFLMADLFGLKVEELFEKPRPKRRRKP
jgi:putative transcriptional regulator